MPAMVSPTLLPDFIPAAVQSFDSRPIRVGDVVTISWGQLVKRYMVTALNEKGEGDIIAEPTVPDDNGTTP